MVQRRNGWTARGDEYGIVGGQSYVKDNGCYQVVFDTVTRIHTIWEIPAKDLSIEELVRKLEGPFEKGEKGSFGLNFLEKYGRRIGQPSRLPPR